MCKCIEKLQTYCLDREINVRAQGVDITLLLTCPEHDADVELEGLGPDYPIAPLDNELIDMEDA